MKHKLNLFLALLMGFHWQAKAQQTSSWTCISSGGSSSGNSTCTIGQVIDATFVATNNQSTCGFQQPEDCQSVLVPSVRILNQGTMQACINQTVRLVARRQNGGVVPTFDWTVKGVPQSATDSVFNFVQSQPGTYQVRVKLNAPGSCIKPNSILSEPVSLEITNNTVTPSISIASPGGVTQVQANIPVTFTVNAMNYAGVNPTIIWLVNGQIQTGVSGTEFNYTPTTFPFTVVAQMTTSIGTCASTQQVNSNTLTLTQGQGGPAISVSKNGADNLCEGQSLQLTAFTANIPGNATIRWFNQNGTEVGQGKTITLPSLSSSPLDQTYEARVDGFSLSNNVIRIKVFQSSNVAPTLSPLPLPAICPGETLTLTANTNEVERYNFPTTYTWLRNNNTVGQTDVKTFAFNGWQKDDVVNVRVKVNGFCLVNDEATLSSPLPTIPFKDVPEVDAGPNDTIAQKTENYTFNGFSPRGGTWRGQNIIGTSEVVNSVGLPVGNFTYYYTFQGECTVTDSVRLTVVPDQMYTIISPFKKDGLNDDWGIMPGLNKYDKVEASIINRNGQEVFKSDVGYKNRFVGKSKDGDDLPVGPYYFVVDLGDGSPIRRGILTIVP